MSVFKRAEWSSGLTYQQVCDQCHTVITYMDNKLDFRPWYADGFIYCPKCNKPLRHRETFAINNPENTFDNQPANSSTDELPLFCSHCGNKFNETDRFCPQCGKKR